MRRLKKFARIGFDDQEGLYETTQDRWSRWAKHHFSKSEIANAASIKETSMESEQAIHKIEEGVLGGVQAMPAINRIMQLAGLEHTGATVVEEEILSEDDPGDMMGRLVAQAQNLPQYKGNEEAARFYVMGSILSVIAKDLSSRPPQTALGQTKMQSFNLLGPLGADLIKAANDLTKAQTSLAFPASAAAPASGVPT